MKTRLITTALSIATTTAFGAASVRAPQLGGGATVTTPAATTNTARAGTMRAQTMKTSSVSTPASVTTTQSVATPVSTETTDARIALLKGIKGFNPGKIKDTTAAQQEINNISSQIEELQAQLDRAEAAQSTVLTEDTIDAKITEKLSILGTSSNARETYSKAEVDALLTEVIKKLPKIDDKGNMTWTDPNGNLVAHSLYWFNFVSQTGHMYMTFGSGPGMFSPIIAHVLKYRTNMPDQAIQQYVSSTVCEDDASAWCVLLEINQLSTGVKIVKVLRLKHGGSLLLQIPTYHGYDLELYWTFENSPLEYIKNMACGIMSEDDCFITTDPNYMLTTEDFGLYYQIPNGQLQPLSTVGILRKVRPYVDLLTQGNIKARALDPNVNIGNISWYQTNYSEEELEEYISSVACDGDTQSSGWCINTQPIQKLGDYGEPYKEFYVYRFYHGYKPGSTDYITNNNTRIQNFLTVEDDAEEYILGQVCGERPSTDCHLAPGFNTFCSSLSDYNSSRQVCAVYIERSPEPGTAWSQQTE